MTANLIIGAQFYLKDLNGFKGFMIQVYRLYKLTTPYIVNLEVTNTAALKVLK